jgi:hypothetical protein
VLRRTTVRSRPTLIFGTASPQTVNIRSPNIRVRAGALELPIDIRCFQRKSSPNPDLKRLFVIGYKLKTKT